MVSPLRPSTSPAAVDAVRPLRHLTTPPLEPSAVRAPTPDHKRTIGDRLTGGAEAADTACDGGTADRDGAADPDPSFDSPGEAHPYRDSPILP